MHRSRFGGSVPIEDSIAPVHDDSGRCHGAVIVFQEITQRVRSEELRRESEEKFRAAFDGAAAGTALVSAGGAIIEANHSLWNMLGFAGRGMKGITLQEIMHPGDLNGFLAQWTALASGNVPSIQLETRYIDRARRPFWVSVSAAAVRDRSGKAGYCILQVQNIDARKRAEDELRQANERLSVMLESLPVVVYSRRAAPGYGVTFVSNNVIAVAGLRPEELTSRDAAWLERVHPDDLPQVLAQLERASGTDRIECEYRWRVASGSYKWFRDCARVVRLTNGQMSHIAGVWQDITEWKRMEEQLLRSQRLEAVGRLAGGIAHDFNNLLTVIIGYAEVALSRIAPPNVFRDSLEDIRTAATRAAMLTNQLLAFSRRQVLQARVVDLNHILEGTESMLRRLIGEDVKLVMTLDPALRNVKVDPAQMEQVVMNLAVNARDAMPLGGTLTLETANVFLDQSDALRHLEVSPGHYVSMKVTDTGSGMDQQTLARIFEPFFTTKEVGKGTGLGLSTVYGIVKQCGGHIMVRSEPGAGTTFEIFLPATEEAASEKDMAALELSRDGGGSETVLVAEDEESLRKLIVEVLRLEGYEVLESESPEHAAALCSQHDGPIHLLLTDVVMPGMSGADLADAVRKARRGIRVLYVSGYTPETSAHTVSLTGEFAFLQKPFTPAALANAVRELLDRPTHMGGPHT
jgi:PAS domain S-box-containing protein